jgi:nucleoside-diphosphate-sugar epimerase
VLITGANGFIGRALMAHLRRAGIPGVGIDLKGDGGDVHAGDAGAPDGWAHLMQGCDVVIHTAALVSNAMKDDDMWRTNVLATRNLLGAAAAHIRGPIEVVIVRPGDVYGPGCRVWIELPLQMMRKREFLLLAVSFRLGLLFGIRSEGSVESVAQLATRSWYSIQKAERRLGWKPEVSFEEGMKRTESWLRHEKAID